VSSPEPFGRLFNQGYIQGYYYEDERGTRRPAIEVVNQDGKPAAEVQGQKDQQFFHDGQPVTERYGKMGKSLKNAIAPDDIIAEHGADTLRAYELYLGPLEASKPWSTRDIVGMSRFLSSVWRKLVSEDGASRVTDDAPDDALLRLTHKTIKKVGELMNDLRFNTAIAALIELNNAIKGTSIPRRVAEPLVLMLSPFAPHLGEELWQRIQGGAWKDSVAMERWPAYDPNLARDERIEVPVQVKGKLRSRIMVAADADAATMQAAALADERIQSEIAGKDIVKIICVPGRLVNIVVK
ncbi:MAG: class I tRNA ligase family protein, partial [Phycisphaerae bacterium]|nr:class I tRNA ligase family protein [Phycisphaerae bacterium]